jgi:hypothetical protein
MLLVHHLPIVVFSFCLPQEMDPRCGCATQVLLDADRLLVLCRWACALPDSETSLSTCRTYWVRCDLLLSPTNQRHIVWGSSRDVNTDRSVLFRHALPPLAALVPVPKPGNLAIGGLPQNRPGATQSRFGRVRGSQGCRGQAPVPALFQGNHGGLPLQETCLAALPNDFAFTLQNRRLDVDAQREPCFDEAGQVRVDSRLGKQAANKL